MVPPLIGVTPLFAVSFWVSFYQAKLLSHLKSAQHLGIRCIQEDYCRANPEPHVRTSVYSRIGRGWFPLCLPYYLGYCTS